MASENSEGGPESAPGRRPDKRPSGSGLAAVRVRRLATKDISEDPVRAVEDVVRSNEEMDPVIAKALWQSYQTETYIRRVLEKDTCPTCSCCMKLTEEVTAETVCSVCKTSAVKLQFSCTKEEECGFRICEECRDKKEFNRMLHTFWDRKDQLNDSVEDKLWQVFQRQTRECEEIQDPAQLLRDAVRREKPNVEMAKVLCEVYQRAADEADGEILELTKSWKRSEDEENLTSQAAGLRLMGWNIRAQPLANNMLEFMPGDGVLSESLQKKFNELLDKTKGAILVPETSPKLGDLLPNILDEITQLEREPIDHQLAGLRTVLESLKAKWPRHWDNQGIDEVVANFMKSPANRWDMWKHQTVHEWLCEDQSGGKGRGDPRTLIPWPLNGIVTDAFCWDLGISTADKYLQNHPRRCARAPWITARGDANHAAPRDFKDVPGRGRADFFKLFIWDAVLAKVLGMSIDADSLAKILEALRPDAPKERTEKIKAVIDGKQLKVMCAECCVADMKPLKKSDDQCGECNTQPARFICGNPKCGKLLCEKDMRQELRDVLVVAEFPAGSDPLVKNLQSEFYIVRPPPPANPADEEPYITAILARRTVFQKPELQIYNEKNGQPSRRIVGCELKRQNVEGKSLHVIGLHLSSSGYGLADELEVIEKAIQPNTFAIIGDFNIDIRTKKVQNLLPKFEKLRPYVEAGLELLKGAENAVTTHKERTPFQAQVSKMFLPDISMKDFILLHPCLKDAPGQEKITGFMDKDEQLLLPNKEFPSDHVPLRVTLAQRTSVYAEPIKQLGGRKTIESHKKESERLQKCINSEDVPEPWRHDFVLHHLTLLAIIWHAAGIKKKFETLLNALALTDWAAALQLEVHMAPVKSLERAQVKCTVRYSGDPSQVSDIVRGTMCIPIPKDGSSVGALYKIIEHMLNSPELGGSIFIVFMDDRFQRQLGNSGYCDIVLLIKLDGFVCEIQLSFKEILAVKNSPTGLRVYDMERKVQDEMLYAAMLRNPEMLKLKLHKGAKPNDSMDLHGLVALHHASHHQSPAMVQMLLDRGARPFTLDKHGLLAIVRPAMSVAGEENDAYKVVKVLMDKMEVVKQKDEGSWQRMAKNVNVSSLAGVTQSVLKAAEAAVDSTIKDNMFDLALRIVKFAIEVLEFRAAWTGDRRNNIWLQWICGRCIKAWDLVQKGEVGQYIKENLGHLTEIPVDAFDVAVKFNIQAIGDSLRLEEIPFRLTIPVFEEDVAWVKELVLQESEKCKPSEEEALLVISRQRILKNDEEKMQEELRACVLKLEDSPESETDDTVREIFAHIAHGTRMPIGATIAVKSTSKSKRKYSAMSALHLCASALNKELDDAEEQTWKMERVKLVMSQLIKHATAYELCCPDGEGRAFVQWFFDSDRIDLFVKLLPKESRMSDLVNTRDRRSGRYGRTPIMWAAEKGKADLIDELMKCSADLDTEEEDNAEKRTALIIACDQDQKDVVVKLIESGANVNLVPACFRSALIWACIEEHEDVVELLLKKKANTRHTYKDKTALSYACDKGNVALVEKLLASTDSVDSLALIQATEKGYVSIVEMLLQHPKINMDQQNHRKETSLIRAAAQRSEGHSAIINMLLEKRADMNKQDEFGRTALMVAVLEGLDDVVQSLRSCGADTELQAKDGRRAIEMAKQKGEWEIVHCLS